MVSRLKTTHEKLICVCHVVRNAVAKSKTDQACPPLANDRQRVACTHRADTGVVIGDLTGVANQRFVEFDHVGVVFPKFVASTITADHYVLWHWQTPSRKKFPHSKPNNMTSTKGISGAQANQCDPQVLTALCVAGPKTKNSNAS